MIYELGTPQPKQDEVLKCTATHIGFGGARGGGKSWVVRFNAKGMGLKYPGIRQLIVRKTYPELQENHHLRYHRDGNRIRLAFHPCFQWPWWFLVGYGAYHFRTADDCLW